MTFTIKHQTFEGPLDLLLQLIESRKLIINDISLASVADDFINYIQNNPNLELNKSLDFIETLSTLILIKSKSLLPNLELTDNEERDIDNLENRLALYKIFQQASKSLQNQIKENKEMFFPNHRKSDDEIIFSPHQSMTIQSMGQSLLSALNKIVKKEVLPQAIVRKTIKLEDAINDLRKRIESNLKLSFSSIIKSKEKVEVIVHFLAILELAKSGFVNINQNSEFSDIEMESNTISIPRYNN